MPTTYSRCQDTVATALQPDAWERTLTALAHIALRFATAHALRRRAQTRRQRILKARAARRLQRSKAYRVRQALLHQLSPALGRDIGLW